MKVLLVYANSVSEGYLPLNVAMISAVLKRAGHKVALFDTSFLESGRPTDRELREKYLEFRKISSSAAESLKKDPSSIIDKFREAVTNFKPDLIGVSSASTEFPFIRPYLHVIKHEFKIPILLGGIHATVSPEKTIQEECLDMICVGEGEDAVVELCDRMDKGQDITNVKNIWIKKDGKLFRNELRPLIEDLDSLPFPDWDLFDKRHFWRPFMGKVKKYGFFELGRGCPFSCTYCINRFLQGLYKGKGKYHREKSVDRMIDEMVEFKKRFGLEHVQFIDDTFLTLSQDKLERFSKLYDEKIKATIYIMARPEEIKPETVKILQTMKCTMVALGVETGNEKFRAQVCKRYMKNSTIVRAFKLLKKGGIKTHAYNLIGLPGETRDLIFETIKLNKKVKPDSFSLKFLCPFEGTEIRKMCIEKGYIKEEDDDMNTMIFEGSMLKMPHISEAELKGLRKTFILYVYMPYVFWPLLRLCEFENPISNVLFDLFTKIYYKFYAK